MSSGGRGPRAGAPVTLTAGLILVLGLLMTVNPITSNIYLPALGEMAEDLGTTVAGAQFALTGFLLGVAGGQLIVGALADSLGRRRVLLWGLAVLCAAGVLVAAAPTLGVLIAGRVLQGLGSSAAIVVARAVVSDTARGTQAARAYSLLMGMLAAGPLIGPLLGTMLLQLGGWRITFVGLLVMSVLYFVVAALTVPETLPQDLRTPVRIGRLLGNYRRLVREPGYLGNALAMGAGFAALATHVSASSFVAQDVLRTDEFGFSFLYICYALAVMGGSALNAPLSARFGPRRMLVASQLVAVASLAALVVLATLGPFTVWTFLATIVPGCASASALLANATTLTLARAAFAAGSGAALMGFMQFTLGAVISPLGGVLGPHTAAPMAIVMLGCVLASAAFGAWGWRAERRAALRSGTHPDSVLHTKGERP
ncbi:multidrug effflux MFS transporter [Microbacterium caowuchunii]|uniref:multidrug effflux MFS transporter n=1 Tax=Microbacterium caowuchunii TaxID=2614638 RepID=UPI001248F7C3|nr:multidrug effflux MFS transporter [Microbacterium caowuchunii]QEW00995.1 multidrug effflux MFS transporter [Microbacterium caowuchunii]